MVAETEDFDEESLRLDCPVLVTERLVMRRPHEDDIPELAELANNRRIAEMLARMPHPYGEADARAFVAMSARREAGAVYALTLADTGAFVGCAGLDATERGLELGYWVGQPYWGRGYATEAARAVIERGFRAGLPEVYAVVRPGNTASVAVCTRLGMTPLGRMRRWYDVELDAFRLIAPTVVD